MKFLLKENSNDTKALFAEKMHAYANSVIEEINNQSFMKDHEMKAKLLPYYNFSGKDWLGVFAKSKQVNKKIFPIAINYDLFFTALSDGTLPDEFNVKLNIEDTIYHELGHGLFNLVKKKLKNYDEEDVVEDFAMCMLNGDRQSVLVDMFSQESPESVALDEALSSLGDSSFITNSAYTVRDLLINKPKAYRILYDANIDSYMICDASLDVHDNLLKNAVQQGYYIGAHSDIPLVQSYIDDMNMYRDVSSRVNYEDLGVRGYYCDEDGGRPIEFPSYLLYMIYIPKGVSEDTVANSPSSDGYDDETEYSFGTLYTRDAYLPDFFDTCDLLKILDRANNT